MDELLTPVSQTYRHQAGEALLTISKVAEPVSVMSHKPFDGSSPEAALEVLKGHPDYDALITVLKYLQRGLKGQHGFDVRASSAQGARFVHILVTEIVPNYWTVLKEASGGHEKARDMDMLVECLSSISGIKASLAYVASLTREARAEAKECHAVLSLGTALQLLCRLLGRDEQVQRLWETVVSSHGSTAEGGPLRQEFVSLLAGGKLVSIAAEAESLLQQADQLEGRFWLAQSEEYVAWLGRNLVSWAASEQSERSLKLCAEISSRSLKLGHAESLSRILFYDPLLEEDDRSQPLMRLLDRLPHSDQRRVILTILKILAARMPSSDGLVSDTRNDSVIEAAIGVLQAVADRTEALRGIIIGWLTAGSGAGIGESCSIRRAAVAVLARDEDSITTVLEKSVAQFGDQLYIKHAPILQQEAHAQVVLLSAGYVHRRRPIRITALLQSGPYLNAVSNRLSATQTRARLLGMMVAEAVSGLSDRKEKRLDFHMQETNSDEAKWYKSLVTVSDKAGPVARLRVAATEDAAPKVVASATAAQAEAMPASRASGPPPSAPTPGFIMEEIDDDKGDEGDELVPYPKPDSDAEDSDDDATLINRDKPKAPVYIRTLITYLRDTENYDHQRLGLTAAPSMIRRKAKYGTEVSAHAEELATLLVGLNNKFDLDGFDDLRLQGMVAVVVALPQKMGPWFCRTFFHGDYSLSQRASVLVVLGLSGRELGQTDGSESGSAATFASKTLPAKTEKYYATPSSARPLECRSKLKTLPPNALDRISHTLSRTFLAPLAAEAADAATGPDILKLSSFTSRLQNPSESSSQPGRQPRARGVRSIPNTSASLLASSFFFPLTSRFQAALHSPSAAARGVVFEPSLLALFLNTLALLLHAAGPGTLALPQMTSELWDLVLAVRAHGEGDVPVTRALLFALVALLDLHADDMRALCDRHGRDMVETVDWAAGVLDRTRGGDGDGEENDVRMLAAAVLIRLKDAVDRYRALLVGDMIGSA